MSDKFGLSGGLTIADELEENDSGSNCSSMMSGMSWVVGGESGRRPCGALERTPVENVWGMCSGATEGGASAQDASCAVCSRTPSEAYAVSEAGVPISYADATLALCTTAYPYLYEEHVERTSGPELAE